MDRTDVGTAGADAGSVGTSYEVWDALRVANAGESRAAFLGGIGFALLGIAVASAVAVGAILTTASRFDEQSFVIIVVLSVSASLPWLLAAAFFLGFSALVRNSSRLLTIVAVSSPLND